MFPKDRNYIFEPFLIKRWFDGEYLTFNVNPYFYDEDSGWVMMTETKSKEFYSGIVKDNTIEVTSKMKAIYPKSYEEFLYLAYGRKK